MASVSLQSRNPLSLGDHLLAAFKEGRASTEEIYGAIRRWNDQVHLTECAMMVSRWEKGGYLRSDLEMVSIAGARVSHRFYRITDSGREFFRKTLGR